MAKKRNIYKNKAGTRLPGVTTITGILMKEALVPWAAKMAVEHLRERWQPMQPYSVEDIEMMLEDAKGAHRRKKVEAGDIGSNIHEIIESYITRQLVPENIENDQERRALENFINVTQDWKWVGAEMIVVNEEVGYGGTADGGAYLPDGTPVLVDVKTSSGVYPEFDLQIAMYALATPTDENLVEFWTAMRQQGEGRILHFNKDRLTWEVLERDMKSQYPFIPHFRECYEWKKRFASQW